MLALRGGEWVTRHDKAWELTSPDVACCTRGVFSPLLMGLHIPVTLDTCVIQHTCFATLVLPLHLPFVSLLPDHQHFLVLQ